MNISSADLLNEMTRASKQWVAIGEVNELYGFPPYLLHAVGSRETNLTNEIGDGGHGHGVFQLDDRYHQIPAGFDGDVGMQAAVAGSMLHVLFQEYGDWVSACNAYNSGSPYSANTAGGDYGPDVMQRQAFLYKMLGDPVSDPVWGVQLVNHYHDTNQQAAPTLTAGDLVSWGATHAAHANEAIAALRADLPGIIQEAITNAVITVEIATKTLA